MELIMRLPSVKEDPFAYLRDGVPFKTRWEEVEGHLKDLGKEVMQNSSPEKLALLKEALGFGPESDDDDDASRARFPNSAELSHSTLGTANAIARRKRRFTLKQAATTIQSWFRYGPWMH